MRIFIYLVFLIPVLTLSCSSDDQDNNIRSASDDLCLVLVDGEYLEVDLDKTPTYIDGGHDGLVNCMLTQISYPSIAKENGTEGLVLLEYEVLPSGSIESVVIHTDIGDGCGQESKRVFELCTPGIAFEPAEINGIRQMVKKYLSISFKLE